MQNKHIRTIRNWYAMSKLRLKSYNSFIQILLLLSGDIALNPGPNSNHPCSKCEKSVRGGVFIKICNMWIHQNARFNQGCVISVRNYIGQI